MPKGRNVVLPLEVGLLTEKAIQRFHAKTEVQADGCILWTGTQTPQSYGFFWIGGYARPAHRVAWMIQHRRDIPPDADIDHLCRVHDCVNPDHLEAVTHWENMRRGVSPVTGTLNGLATDGTCARGHDLSLPRRVAAQRQGPVLLSVSPGEGPGRPGETFSKRIGCQIGEHPLAFRAYFRETMRRADGT